MSTFQANLYLHCRVSLDLCSISKCLHHTQVPLIWTLQVTDEET